MEKIESASKEEILKEGNKNASSPGYLYKRRAGGPQADTCPQGMVIVSLDYKKYNPGYFEDRCLFI